MFIPGSGTPRAPPSHFRQTKTLLIRQTYQVPTVTLYYISDRLSKIFKKVFHTVSPNITQNLRMDDKSENAAGDVEINPVVSHGFLSIVVS